MDRGFPDDRTVRAALALAVRAPSLHDSQPWRWRVGGRTVHLYADRERQLPGTDPDGRDLLLGCGAALHHLHVIDHHARPLGQLLDHPPTDTAKARSQ